MHVMFDLAGTVFGLLDMSLRPGIRETLAELRCAGIKVDFWTSGSVENYSALLGNSGIEGEVYSKHCRLPFTPDVCVDDDPCGATQGRVVKVRPHIAIDYPCDRIDALMLIRGMAA